MCDTFIFRSENATDKRIWFGKNSDREPNEAHEVVFRKGQKYTAGTRVKCTYIEVPQVESTFDVILCKPAWMWGAEMGINAQGVVIGNEALFTKGKPPKEPALTGMDLLRLALERSCDAQSALQCIIQLLETYGQGGNCGYRHPFYYNNSFLIADRNETWILETVDRNWAAKRYAGSTSISNGLTLHNDWDKRSAGFSEIHDLAGQMSDPLVTTFSMAKIRRECTLDGISAMGKSEDIRAAFNLLRSHNGKDRRPSDSVMENTVCMHAGWGPIRIDQTTGSMVVDLSKEPSVIWITGTSAPCLSVFRPIIFSDFHEDTVISSEADWQRNEVFHRKALFCGDTILDTFSSERDQLELEFVKENEKGLRNQLQVTRRVEEFSSRWREKMAAEKPVHGRFLLRVAWNVFNREAGFKIANKDSDL